MAAFANGHTYIHTNITNMCVIMFVLRSRQSLVVSAAVNGGSFAQSVGSVQRFIMRVKCLH